VDRGGGPPPPPFKPVADVKQLMQGAIDPNADIIWEATGTIVSKAGTENRRPKSQEQWDAVRNSAIVLTEAGNLRLRGGNVPDDKNGLAGLDQSELAARHFFDRRGIFTEPPCLLSQTRVLDAQAGNRGGEPFVLLTCAMHREQASITHETIGDNHTGDEEQHDMNDPSVA